MSGERQEIAAPRATAGVGAALRRAYPVEPLPAEMTALLDKLDSRSGAGGRK